MQVGKWKNHERLNRKHTPSESTSKFSSIRSASFKQLLQKPFFFLTCTNSAVRVHVWQTAFGQQKHWRLELFLQMKHECQPVISEVQTLMLETSVFYKHEKTILGHARYEINTTARYFPWCFLMKLKGN